VPDHPVIPRQLLLLALLGVWTHPMLDLLNTYGIRLFMPFSDTWFFGDTLFIVDPWVWMVLAVGIVLQRRRDREGHAGGMHPAAAALAVVLVYVAAMATSNVAARRFVSSAVVAQGLPQPNRLMIAPMPVNPFQRRVVIETGDHYRFGQWHWLSTRLDLADLVYDTEPTDFGAAAATRGPEVRKFLSWARFPYWETVDGVDGRTVYVGDARYTLDARGGSWATIAVR
jgi:inner membrane protein